MKQCSHPGPGPPHHHRLAQSPGISVPGTPGSSHSSITRSSDEESSWAVGGLWNVSDLSPALRRKLRFHPFSCFVMFRPESQEQEFRMSKNEHIQLLFVDVCCVCWSAGCVVDTRPLNHDLPAFESLREELLVDAWDAGCKSLGCWKLHGARRSFCWGMGNYAKLLLQLMACDMFWRVV